MLAIWSQTLQVLTLDIAGAVEERAQQRQAREHMEVAGALEDFLLDQLLQCRNVLLGRHQLGRMLLAQLIQPETGKTRHGQAGQQQGQDELPGTPRI